MTIPYKVDLTPNRATPTVVNVSQGDIKRLLVFKVTDDAGTDWSTTDYTFILRGTKPSSLGFQVPGTVSTDASGPIISFYTTKTMTSEAGIIPAEIRVYDEDTNTTLGTANIILAVERNPHPPGTTDGDENTALTLMQQAAAYLAQCQTLATQVASDAADAEAAAELAEQYKDLAFSGTPEGYEALATKVSGIPANIETRQDIIRRKVLALTAGLKDSQRWPLRTYYEVVDIEDDVVAFRYAGRRVSMSFNSSAPANYGLVNTIYTYGFNLSTFYKDRTYDNTVDTHIYFDGRPKTLDDVAIGDVTTTVTVYKQLTASKFIVLKMDATGIHVWMLYDTAPGSLATLVNADSTNPNFVSVFKKVAGESVEVTEVDSERSLVTVQSATWTANTWHKVDVYW